MSLTIGTTETVTLELAGAPATTQPQYFAGWCDEETDEVGSGKGVLNGTTPVTAVASPTALNRLVHGLWVCNLDTASVVVIVKITGGTTRTVIKRTLAAGEARDLVGTRGETGEDGAAGANGADGADGADGAPGAPGADGADGDTIPDSEAGKNYSLVLSIASDDATIALKTRAGADPSAGSPATFDVGGALLSVESALSLTLDDAAGDIFGWDAGKIQGNDADLFVYLINMNGTPMLGASPCPTLRSVATNYYIQGTGQTGAAGHTNIWVSGAYNATNSCRVIGRVAIQQQDDNDWQAPATSLVINRPIFETEWRNWTPTYGGFGATLPTNVASRYKLSYTTCSLHIRQLTAGVSNSATFTYTAPILSANVTNAVWESPAQVTDNGTLQAGAGVTALNPNTQTSNVYLNWKGDGFTTSGNKRVTIPLLTYEVPG